MAANVDQKEEEGAGVDTDEKANALSEDICSEIKRRMYRVVTE